MNAKKDLKRIKRLSIQLRYKPNSSLSISLKANYIKELEKLLEKYKSKIDKLEPDESLVFQGVYLEGKSHKQLAQELGYSQSWVQKKALQIKIKLQKKQD